MIDSSRLKDIWIQLLATLIGCLIAVSNGMAYGWPAPMVPYFLSNQTHIPITHAQGEWLETLLFFGSACGLPATIYVVNHFGRKGSMIISCCLSLICWIIILFTTHFWVLCIARMLCGASGNMCFIGTPMYIAEIADHRIRGFLASSVYIMMLVGILIVYAAGALLPYYAVPTIGIVLTVSEIVFFPFMPESPYFYTYNNENEKAERSLKRLRPGTANIEKEMEEIRAAVERQKTEKGRLQDLFMIKSNRYAMCVMFLLHVSEHFIGISVIMLNIHVILEEAGSIYMSPSLAAILFAITMVVGGLCASVIIDKFGRKFLLISSALITGVVLLILTIYFHLKNVGHDVSDVSWIPIICVMLYAATFKVGLGVVPMVIAAEIFPAPVKAMGMTFADLFYITGATCSIYVYVALYNSFGIHVPFYLFTCCSFGTALLIYFFVPETKGKTLEQIQLMLKGHKQ